jgi:hypothetical protein
LPLVIQPISVILSPISGLVAVKDIQKFSMVLSSLLLMYYKSTRSILSSPQWGNLPNANYTYPPPNHAPITSYICERINVIIYCICLLIFLLIYCFSGLAVSVDFFFINKQKLILQQLHTWDEFEKPMRYCCVKKKSFCNAHGFFWIIRSKGQPAIQKKLGKGIPLYSLAFWVSREAIRLRLVMQSFEQKLMHRHSSCFIPRHLDCSSRHL